MANVYKVTGQMEYVIEIIAADAGEAEEIAYQMAPSMWDPSGKIYVDYVDKLTSNPNEYFGPDRIEDY